MVACLFSARYSLWRGKCMRERKNFGERTKALTGKEPRKKYFLVFEGEATEEIYFEKLNLYRHKYGIRDLIELVPIIRSYNEKGWSNPRKILDSLIDLLDEENSGTMSYGRLLTLICDFLIEKEEFKLNEKKAPELRIQIAGCFQEFTGKLEDYDVADNEVELICRYVLSSIVKEINPEKLVQEVAEYVDKNGTTTYDKDLDEICLVFDRDAESFTSEQYDYVAAKCSEKGYKLYITNPCFEFWLLMHFDKVFEISQDEYQRGGAALAEMKLRNCLGAYQKTKYDVERILNNLDCAIENETQFCETVPGLKLNIGSNVGKLIQELRQ